MPTYQLNDELWFPSSDLFDHDVVAVGGDLSPERLVLAYSLGIFPWYGDDEEILWWCPDPRCVLMIGDIKVSRSMRNILNRKQFSFSFDRDFKGVIHACRNIKRKDKGTWIHDEVEEAFIRLHELGLAHSVEVWSNRKLAGGLYGLSLGRMFFGESMFSREPNASKSALLHLHTTLAEKGFRMIDCQVYNEHLGSLGATTMERNEFLELMRMELQHPTIRGNWSHITDAE